jgi:hypothetical protein
VANPAAPFVLTLASWPTEAAGPFAWPNQSEGGNLVSASGSTGAYFLFTAAVLRGYQSVSECL